MCGIFGYTGIRPPDLALLEDAATAAGRRGPHGCGWALRSDLGGLRAEHHAGLMADYTAAFRRSVAQSDASAVLGHARLATVGDWRQVDQLQPVPVQGHALAHNGVIANPGDLHPDGHATDSIALAHGYAAVRATGASPYAALTDLMSRAAQTAWAVVVLDANGGLYAHRHYHPLYVLTSTEGTYLSSQRLHPDATLLPEDTAVRI